MDRLVYSLDDARTAMDIVRQLRARGIDDKHLALAARHDIETEQLPDDYVAETTDFGPAVARGAALGGTAGLFAGLVVAAFPVFGIALGGALLLMTTAGATVGAWAGSLWGSNTQSSLRRACEDEINAGRVLVAVEPRDDDERHAVEALVAAQGGRARRITLEA